MSLKKFLIFLSVLIPVSICSSTVRADISEVEYSTFTGDFPDGGKYEVAEQLIGGASWFGFGILQGNLVRVFVSSGTNDGTYTPANSTPTTAGYVGIWTDGITQIPQYHLDVWGIIRSTDGAYFATSQGNVGIGTTNPEAKFHVVGSSVILPETWIDGVNVSSITYNADILAGKATVYFSINPEAQVKSGPITVSSFTVEGMTTVSSFTVTNGSVSINNVPLFYPTESPDVVGMTLTYKGENELTWKTPVGGSGAGAVQNWYFYDKLNTDVENRYETMLTTPVYPITYAEHSVSMVASDGWVSVTSYSITNDQMGNVTRVPAGNGNVHYCARVNSSVGKTKFLFRFSTSALDGITDKTEWYSSTGTEINNTDNFACFDDGGLIFTDLDLSTYTTIILEVFAKTNTAQSKTVRFVCQSSTLTPYVETPINSAATVKSLDDTPASYTGQSGKGLKLDETGTEWEYVDFLENEDYASFSSVTVYGVIESTTGFVGTIATFTNVTATTYFGDGSNLTGIGSAPHSTSTVLSGLRISTTDANTIIIAADAIDVGGCYTTDYSSSVDMSLSGFGGSSIGDLPSTFYKMYVTANSDCTGFGVVVSSGNSREPSNYYGHTKSRNVSCFYNDSSADLTPFVQVNDIVSIVKGYTILDTGTPATSATTVDMVVVPSSSTEIRIAFKCCSEYGGTNSFFYIRALGVQLNDTALVAGAPYMAIGSQINGATYHCDWGDATLQMNGYNQISYYHNTGSPVGGNLINISSYRWGL